MPNISMWIVWLILLVVFLIIEAATLGLATIWCAAGCLVAMVLDLVGCSTTVQLIAMIAVSVICFVICMIWIKPMIDQRRMTAKEPTNADRVIGHEGIVIKTIDPIDGKGQVKVIGQTWSAKSGKSIPEGASIKVVGMEGVKLIVEEKNS
ncbi:MAG: NfeD family protein [Clostridiales bacterium]|nr:NfeD family protein [Clostridiales bacterium]